jgi:SAM-dependent methyltransferase
MEHSRNISAAASLWGWLPRKRRRLPTPRALRALLAPLNPRSQPNLNELRAIANTITPLCLNIKQSGYALARRLAAALPCPEATEPCHVGLRSSLSTQAAIESDWVAHWCRELGIARVYHRKIWELCFALQAMHEAGVLREDARGLGFGCGTEALASYLAAQGVSVMVTDLAPELSASSGWMRTGQHATAAEQAFWPHLVDRATFDRLVRMRHVDMNEIPEDLTDFDFCWSICALEHLGSIELGLKFVENSLRTLKPGGLAVHTTEYNIRHDGPTIDNWPTVALQRRHLQDLARGLERAGHAVAPFDFDLGDGPLDGFVDLPPHVHELPDELARWLGAPAHLKVAFEGLVVTCAGLIVRKRAE